MRVLSLSITVKKHELLPLHFLEVTVLSLAKGLPMANKVFLAHIAASYLNAIVALSIGQQLMEA